MLRQLISCPKNIFRSLDLRSQISDQKMWIISKSHREKKFFLIFLQSIHQVDMKNVVKCYKDFFPYFKALKTNCVIQITGRKLCQKISIKIQPILIQVSQKLSIYIVLDRSSSSYVFFVQKSEGAMMMLMASTLVTFKTH